MKTIAILMTVLLALGMMVSLVAAEDLVDSTDDVELADAGVTPDSSLYGLEKAMERLNLAFTFGKANKAKKTLGYAEERLSEMRKMAEEGNVEAAETAQEEHDELINETAKLVDEIESDSSEDVAEDALEDVAEIQTQMQTHSQKVASVKNTILARMADGNMSEEQLAHLTEVFNKIINKSQEMELKMEQKRENVRTKLKVLSNKTEDELDDVEEQARERGKVKLNETEDEEEDEEELENETEDEDEEELENEDESEDELENETPGNGRNN